MLHRWRQEARRRHLTPRKAHPDTIHPQQPVPVMSNVQRQLSQPATTATAASAPSAPGAATPAAAIYPSDSQLTPEPDPGAEPSAGSTVAAESGDPLAEPATGAVAAAESSGSDGQRPVPERQEGGT